MEEYGLTTQLVHAERRQGVENGAVHKPIYTSSQYAYDDANDLVAVFQGRPGFSYARQGTPTTAALEKTIDQMEGGVGTCSFATGMAALTAIFYTLLKAGDHIISSQFIFGNTNSLLMNLARLGVEVTQVDARDIEQVRAAIRPNTRMVFMETIANPGTQLVDLAAIGELCEEQQLLYVLDNTMTTPYLLKGKEVKAGLVMNSLSKIICGHANALGGAVTNTGLFDWSHYPNIYEDYKSGDAKNWGLLQIRKKGLRDMGATLSADAAQRIAIGAETFEMRMERSCANALALATFLEQPGETMNFAPAAMARSHCSLLMTVPAPTSISGNFWTAREIAASAHSVRKQISATGSPPLMSAESVGSASSIDFNVTTGTSLHSWIRFNTSFIDLPP